MTLDELDSNLPNRFHDAEIFSFELDYAAGTAKFLMNLLVGWPTTQNRSVRRTKKQRWS